MNDRAVSLLDQYEIEVEGTRKGRDAFLCDCDKGTLIFKEYRGKGEHLALQDCLLKTIKERGFSEAESLIPTKEGELFVKDGDGILYVLKTYREGRECNVKDPEECLAAVRLLAKLHLCMQEGLSKQVAEASPQPEEQEASSHAITEPPVFQIADEYEKRGKQLRKIRKYLLGRSQKTWFEIALLSCFDAFYAQADEAKEGWNSYRAAGEGRPQTAYCHGDYQYHNVLFDQRRACVINFERCLRDDPVRDLHLLLRKLMEKNNWSIPLGERLLNEYQRVRPLSAISWIDLYYRLAYPEKFWKIANFYYNSGKAWIPEKNMEKLEKLMAREREKKEFLEAVFRI